MMECGHPLAARAVQVYAIGPNISDRRLRTHCWACAVERELAARLSKPNPTPGVVLPHEVLAR